jgi:hypothetical protein
LPYREYRSEMVVVYVLGVDAFSLRLRVPS